ncbi:MAG: hypothetical protein WBH77_09930 [Saccharofermentanales bacterium]
MAKLKIDGFTDAVIDILQKTLDDTIHGLNQATRKIALKAKQQVRDGAPERTGIYANDWAMKKEPGFTDAYFIYNRKHYRLTHLLEFGHIVHGTGLRTRAFPHIAPVQEMLDSTFTEEAIREINNENK